MGVVLDSTLLIDAERRGWPVARTLERIRASLGEEDIIVAAMTAAELVHGVWRATLTEVRSVRERFVEDVFASIPVRIAGRIDAESRAKGITIPTADLLIGATA